MTLLEASLTLTEMTDFFRQTLCGTDNVNTSATNAEIATELNHAFAIWHQSFGRRMKYVQPFGAAKTTAQTLPGLSYTTSSSFSTILSFEHLYHGDYGAELEILKLSDVIKMQYADTTPGTPKYAAVVKAGGTPDVGVGYWNLYLYPMPALPATAIYALCQIESYMLDAGTPSDRFDCSNAESRIVVAIAAGRMAERLGLSESLIDGIWKTVPNDVQAVVRMSAEMEPEPHGRGFQ